MSVNDLEPPIDAILSRGRLLEEQGVPFPVDSLRISFGKALSANDRAKVLRILERAERLYNATYTRWVPVRDLLSRAEVLRATAEELGIETGPLEAEAGNPRAIVHAGPLSGEIFEKAREMAERSIAALGKAIVRRGKEEAGRFGSAIQQAAGRGENVREATAAFRALLDALRLEPSPVLAQRLETVRRLIAEIPSAPAVAFPEIEDADEILLEARILARRIQRIKRNARDAQSAARLMSHVRAALSEDRRAAPSPQEEIEELWGEVTRLSQERRGLVVSEATAPAIPPPMRRPRDDGSPYAIPNLVLSESNRPDPPPDGRNRRRSAPRA